MKCNIFCYVFVYYNFGNHPSILYHMCFRSNFCKNIVILSETENSELKNVGNVSQILIECYKRSDLKYMSTYGQDVYDSSAIKKLEDNVKI